MTTPVSSVSSASQLTTNYLNLLITQLKNQNPLDPMDNSQMTSQMAQLSQLQSIEDLKTSFDKALSNSQLQYANSLIGKEVAYTTTSSNGTTSNGSGVVQGVEMVNNAPMIVVNNTDVDPASVTAIANQPSSGQ